KTALRTGHARLAAAGALLAVSAAAVDRVAALVGELVADGEAAVALGASQARAAVGVGGAGRGQAAAGAGAGAADPRRAALAVLRARLTDVRARALPRLAGEAVAAVCRRRAGEVAVAARGAQAAQAAGARAATARAGAVVARSTAGRRAAAR